MTRSTLVLSGLLVLAALPCRAEEDQTIASGQDVGQVMVTATRTERTTEEIPAGVSTVGEEVIEHSRMLGIKEALVGLPGVQAETKNNGYDARLIIRGSGLKARYGVREIMVLLDGVPITDPDGMSRFDFVDTQLIEQVEVVRGPNSTLYGANASGGVVNIITKSPMEEIESLKIGYGDDNTQLATGLFSKAVGDSYVNLSATRKSSDGWRAWNEFDSTLVGLKVGHVFADESMVELAASYTDADLQLPGSLSAQEFAADPSQATTEFFRHSSRDSRVRYATLRGEKGLGELSLKPVGYLQSWDHFHPVPGGINEADAWVYGVDLPSDWQHHPAGLAAVLTVGLSGQIDSQESEKFAYADLKPHTPANPGDRKRFDYTLSDRKSDLIETSDSVITKWGVYAQESLRPSDRWIVDLGVRYDQVLFDIDTERFGEFDWSTSGFSALRETVAVDKTFEQISPRLGVVHKTLPWLNLYGSVATGFRTPQGAELEDNPDLDPATSLSYEIGGKGRLAAGHSFDLAVFREDVDDDIVQALVESGIVTYSNAGAVRKHGVELAGEVQALTGLAVGGSYTYSDFEYDEFAEPITAFNPVLRRMVTTVFDRGGNQLPYIPRHQYALYGRYQHPAGLRLKLSAATWGSYFVDSANSEKYQGYELVTSLFVGYEQGPWALALDVANLWDDTYAMEVTKTASTNDTRYVPGGPRSVFASVTYRF
ncbi:MAG: TonB-dependent receptor [Thermodesulfobacteriota bacterium]